MTFVRETLDQHLQFANGKTSPERSEHGVYAVFGSNGEIGRSDEQNSPAQTTIIGRVGSYCGSVHYSPEPCWVTDNAIRATAKAPGEGRFWFFALANQNLHDLRAGSGQPLINQTSLKGVELPVPGAADRKKIGTLLGSIDDKIKLNREISETLEEIARSLFKDWFVDFGPTRRQMGGATDPVSIMGGAFPAEEAASLAVHFPAALGEDDLPEGWKATTLGDVVEPRKGRSITKKTVVPGDVPVVAGGLDPAYFHDTPNVAGPVITASASGANAGFVRLYQEDIWASDCSFISREQTRFVFSIYALLSLRQSEIYKMQHGAAQPHVYPSDLARLGIVDAPDSLWMALEGILEPLFALVAANEEEGQNLARIRDLLLPKLMSGEIHLNDVEAAR